MHISGIKVKMIALKCKLTCNSFLTFTYSSLSCNVSKCLIEEIVHVRLTKYDRLKLPHIACNTFYYCLVGT